MDEYGVNGAPDALPDEYAALADARQVMREVLGLVEDLHRVTTRLGDALVAGGLPARMWRGPDGDLLLLSDQFPDITLDEVVTRLAEFAAGMGPHWLRGGPEDVARFNDEVSILYGVARPLRIAAQRLRMLPARERGDYPLERALGDPRVGTPLDRATTILRDLESLGPYLQPLTPEEWNPPAPEPARVNAWQPTPAVAGAGGEREALHEEQSEAAGWPGVSATPVTAARQESPQTQSQSQSQSQSLAFQRLRDFMPAEGSRPARAAHATTGAFAWRGLPVRSAALAGEAARWLEPRKWLVVGVTVMVLALGTALLTLLSQPAPAASALSAVPGRLAFTCSGAEASLTVKLRDGDSRPLTWTVAPPAGLSLSPAHGVLQPSASVTVRIQVTAKAAKAAKVVNGLLAFTSNDGDVSVPYTVTCT